MSKAWKQAARADDQARIFEQAHEIRGLAGNAGLIATGRIANNLCKYLDALDQAGRQPDQGLVALHLEAIGRAAHAEDEATRLGDAVANELAHLVDKKLAEINDFEQGAPDLSLFKPFPQYSPVFCGRVPCFRSAVSSSFSFASSAASSCRAARCRRVLEAVPHEVLTIGGAATAALLIGGSMYTLKKMGGDVSKVISGPKWKPGDYRDLLCLLFLLAKTMKSKGLIALEAHIEKPAESSIFKRYPRISKDHFALAFICDTLRMMTMSLEDPHQVEAAMEKQLEKHHHEALATAIALQTMADGLPALGIVAAVLGVIKTMGAISEPPEVLGRMIGSALVGTFMGVFLAYGIVGPISVRLKSIIDEEALFYHVIRDILVAHLHGNAAQISVEIGRGSVPSEAQPTFQELEQALDNIPPEHHA